MEEKHYKKTFVFYSVLFLAKACRGHWIESEKKTQPLAGMSGKQFCKYLSLDIYLKYFQPYLLRNIEITYLNQVWSTFHTYHLFIYMLLYN